MKNYLASPVGPNEFVALMALLMSIVAISIDAMVPALGMMGADLGVVEANHVQYVIGFIFVGMAMGQLVSGPLSDAVGRRNVVFATMTLYLLGSVICYFAGDLQTVLFGRFLQGLGVSGPYVASISIVRDKYHGRQMAKMMSLIMMIFIMVPAVAPSLGQGILYLADWRAIFGMYILYSVVIIGWMALRMDETLPKTKRVPFKLKNLVHGVGKVFGTHTTRWYMVCIGFVFGGLMGYLNSCQQIFQEMYNVGDWFAICFGGLALAFGASSMVNAKLVEKMGMRPLCKRAMVSNIVLSGVFLAVNLVMVPPLWMFLLYAALVFFSFGMLFGNLNALAMEPMGSIAGLASAIIGAFSSVISLVAGIVIGQAYDGTLVPLAAGFLVMGAAAFGAFMMAREK